VSGLLAQTASVTSGQSASARELIQRRIERPYSTSHESRRGREAVQSRLEAVLAKRLCDPCVVDGSVGVDPVALWIHSKSEDFGQVRTFEQDLLTGDEAREQVQLHFVQLKQLRIVPAVQRRIRQEQLRRTALDDRAQKIGGREVLDGLRRQNHGGVALPPCLQAFLHVGSQRRMLNEPPGLVHHTDLQRGGIGRILNARDNAMQDVEQ